MTGAHVCVVSFYFVYPFVEVGAHGWFVDTAGQVGDSIRQGLGCWPAIGLFWAPDLHWQQMLLTPFNYI